MQSDSLEEAARIHPIDLLNQKVHRLVSVQEIPIEDKLPRDNPEADQKVGGEGQSEALEGGQHQLFQGDPVNDMTRWVCYL